MLVRFLVGLVFFLPLFSAQAYVIHFQDDYAEDVRILAERYITLVYQAINVEPEFYYSSSMDGLYLADSGGVDALLGRLEKVGSAFPELVPVMEPIAQYSGSIFCLQPQLCQLNAKQMYLAQASSEMQRIFCMEQGLSCLFVSNKTSAASLLLQHPNYGLIGWDPEIMGSLCESGIKTLHHKPIAALKLPVYHYVNKRHADKVDALKQAILRLRNLGVPKNLLQMAVHAGDSCDVQVHTIAS